MLAAISRAKNHLVARERFAAATPDELGGLVLHDDIKQIVASVWAQVDAELERSDALDFDDLIAFTVALLERRADVLAGYRRRWRYVQVDEHQDTNPLQDRLLRLLAGEHPNLMVVGDDQQAIYAFRGADVRNILRFDRDYPQARVVRARAQLPLDAAGRRGGEPADRPQHHRAAEDDGRPGPARARAGVPRARQRGGRGALGGGDRSRARPRAASRRPRSPCSPAPRAC